MGVIGSPPRGATPRCGDPASRDRRSNGGQTALDGAQAPLLTWPNLRSMNERPENQHARDNDEYVPHELEEMRDATEHGGKREDDENADDE